MTHPVTSYASVLALHALEVDIHLGVGEEERARPQKVIIDMRLYLPSLPGAAESDEGDYICYHTLSEKIRALCLEREYRLIEYLAHAIHRLLRESVPAEIGIWVKLRKPQILLPYVRGGSSYTYSDLAPHAWVVPE